MRENDEVIVVCEVRADIIFGEIAAALDRQSHRAVLVHYVDVGDVGVAVDLRELIAHRSVSALPAVSGVALDDGAVKRLHKLADQVGAKVVAAVLAGRNFDRDFPLGISTQSLINRHKTVGTDVGSHVDDRKRVIRGLLLAVG